MPSNPVWTCPSTPDLVHEPCEAETPPSELSAIPRGLLSVPLLLGTSVSPGPAAALQRPIPAVLESALHASSPRGKKRRESSAHRPGPGSSLGLRLPPPPFLAPRTTGSPGLLLSALSGAAPRPPPRRPPSAPGPTQLPPHGCPEPRACPSAAPRSGV